MANAESSRAELLAAKNLSDEVFESALELHAIINEFAQLDKPPGWAYPLARMAERTLALADASHTAVLRIPGVVEVSS
jgi:hypothetical protein